MQIAILGGTGDVGEGLAVRFARDSSHEVVVGSRDAPRAERAATTYRDDLVDRSGVDDAEIAVLRGCSNDEAVETADVVIACVPPEHLRATIDDLTSQFQRDAILVTPAVALRFTADGTHYERPEEGSYTAIAADAAPEDVPVVGAFHTLSAHRLGDLDRPLDADVLVVGDDSGARRTIADLAESIDGLRALDVGPTSNADAVETLTALQVTVGQHNDELRHVGVRFE